MYTQIFCLIYIQLKGTTKSKILNLFRQKKKKRFLKTNVWLVLRAFLSKSDGSVSLQVSKSAQPQLHRKCNVLLWQKNNPVICLDSRSCLVTCSKLYWFGCSCMLRYNHAYTHLAYKHTQPRRDPDTKAALGFCHSAH